MGPTVSIGNQDFASMREKGCFYIDKTGFIRDWWSSEDVVTLITRPRRFGKTLNMSMLNWFFSNQHAGRADLFEGLDIWDDGLFRSIQGTRPVIFLSFAKVKGADYQTARKQIAQIISRLYGSYEHLRDNPAFTQRDAERFASVAPSMDDATLSDSIGYLCECLWRCHDTKTIILLDEYDTPLEKAYVNGFWNEMVELVQPLFNATFKTNPYLERAVLTGVTRVSKESIFSDLNNLEIVSTTSESYETAFGFTEAEIRSALAQYGMQDRMDDVRYWYDGFRFGKQGSMYNPWSITKFLDTGKLGAWWANTSANSLVSKLIREGSADIKTATESLLGGGHVLAHVDEDIVFSSLDRSESAIWSLLLATGYLKVDDVSGEPGDELYRLSLTNHEVVLMFRKMIRSWFDGPRVHYNDFVKALLACDLDFMNSYMDDIALATFSSFDVGRGESERAEPERFYHGFVLGLIVGLRDRYRITSNRESGLGRYDVVMRPLGDTDPAFVLEFKVRRPHVEASLEDTVAAAHTQIEEKAYDTELVAAGIAAERIRHFGFAFEGKQALIG